MEGIKLINLFFNKWDVVSIKDIEDAYFNISFRDLYKDNAGVDITAGKLSLIIRDKFKILISYQYGDKNHLWITNIANA